jgi:hypothetical protein
VQIAALTTLAAVLLPLLLLALAHLRLQDLMLALHGLWQVLQRRCPLLQLLLLLCELLPGDQAVWGSSNEMQLPLQQQQPLLLWLPQPHLPLQLLLLQKLLLLHV